MQTQKFKRLINQQNKRHVMTLAWETANQLLEAHDTIIIEVREKTRSDEQNAKLHALLSDIARQKEFNGQKRTMDEWKMIFVSGHRIATGGQAEMAIGLENEVINLRESTAKMSVKRLASLIEYITAWAVENGVKLNGF